MQTRSFQPVAAQHDTRPRPFGALLEMIAAGLRRRPDQSLVNAKFTDDLERELLGQRGPARTWRAP